MRPPTSERFNIASYFLDRPAAAHPQRTAILGEPAALTYGELQRLTNRFAGALRRAGCRPGDRVLIVLPDSAEFVAAFFGSAKIGAIAVPVNPLTRRPDYEFFVQDLSPRVCVVHQFAWEEFAPGLPVKNRPLIVRCGLETDQAQQGDSVEWEEFLRTGHEECEAHATVGTDRAFFLYTSGSSGRPKAAIHQHKDMLVTSTNYAHRVLGIHPGDVTFSVSKLFFAYGLGNAMYFPFSVGAGTVFLPERPRPERVLEIVARYRPSLFFAVPTMYGALLRAAESGAPADFSSVRCAVSAGEALPAEIFEQFRQRFGLRILDGIGSTEMLHMFISNRPGEARAGTCGVEVPGCKAQILDEAGSRVPQGEIGNLWVRGPSALEGYWNRADLTAEIKRDEWVATGDKFFQDAEGWFHYCGRRDDMFKVAGMWVAPGEVENALLAHPQVAEAAVVEGKDGAGLSFAVAYVVLRETERGGISWDEVAGFVRQRLPGYKCPREMHILRELPKTATGKIQRFRLRELPPGPS
jgi:benzoate-CoA ligase